MEVGHPPHAHQLPSEHARPAACRRGAGRGRHLLDEATAPAPLPSGWVDSVLYDLSQECKVTEYAPSFRRTPTRRRRATGRAPTSRRRAGAAGQVPARRGGDGRGAYDYCVAGGDGLLGLHADLRYDPLAPKTCKDFTRVDGSAGQLTLLRGVGEKALNDPTRVQIFPRVHTAAGCCEYATRHQCAANPVRAWQLVGKQCVLLRAAHFEMKTANIGDADWDGVPETYIKGETVRELVMRLAKSAPVLDANHAPGGDIFYTDNPKCTGVDPADSGGYDGGGTIAPCREDRAAAPCTGNDKALCYYDVTCKRGGLGCNAAGYEMCRFCEFDFSAEGGANYSSVPCPRTAAAPGYAVEVQLPGAACPSTCTSDPTDTCYYDASCSDPMVDGTGCHAGGHKNCRFCGLAAAAGWVGSGAVRDCPQLDLQLITGAADASTSTGAQAAQLVLTDAQEVTIELPVFADYPDPNGIAGEIPLPIQKVGDLYKVPGTLVGNPGQASVCCIDKAALAGLYEERVKDAVCKGTVVGNPGTGSVVGWEDRYPDPHKATPSSLLSPQCTVNVQRTAPTRTSTATASSSTRCPPRRAASCGNRARRCRRAWW